MFEHTVYWAVTFFTPTISHRLLSLSFWLPWGAGDMLLGTHPGGPFVAVVAVPCYTWPFELHGGGRSQDNAAVDVADGDLWVPWKFNVTCARRGQRWARPGSAAWETERQPGGGSGGGGGGGARFVPCGMDNEVSVSTCLMERWGSVSCFERAQVTDLICPLQVGDMICSRGALGLNVLSVLVPPRSRPLVVNEQTLKTWVRFSKVFQKKRKLLNPTRALDRWDYFQTVLI